MIPKPEIPPDIAHNYKQVKVQWTEQLVATQQQKTEAIKKETQQLKVTILLTSHQPFKLIFSFPFNYLLPPPPTQQAVADANREKAVLEIKIQERILEVEGAKNVSTINNEILQVKHNLT